MTTGKSEVAFKRLSREERYEELLNSSIELALEDGLARVTARKIAARLGVAQGLITHYFGSVDALLAATFERVAESDRPNEDLMDSADPMQQIQVLLEFNLSQNRDPAALLWLDAWRESAHRPAIRDAVVRQMERDLVQFDGIIAKGIEAGVFPRASKKSAMRILAVVDGLAANAAVRAGLSGSMLNYENATDFVYVVVENELGVPQGSLRR